MGRFVVALRIVARSRKVMLHRTQVIPTTATPHRMLNLSQCLVRGVMRRFRSSGLVSRESSGESAKKTAAIHQPASSDNSVVAEQGNDALRALSNADRIRRQDQIGSGRLLEDRADAGELCDLARVGGLIGAAGVAGLEYVDRGFEEDFDE